MLALTPDAVTAIASIIRESSLPADGGLRISAAADDAGGAVLNLALAEGSIDGDVVLAHEDARVFVHPDVAPVLDDKVLDATVDGDSLSFSLDQQ